MEKAVLSLKLTPAEFEKASSGKHTLAETNRKVIDYLNCAEQIRVVVYRRSQLKAEIAKNKADNRMVSVPTSIVEAAKEEAEQSLATEQGVS